MSAFLIAGISLLSLIAGLAVLGVAQLGCIISQLADLKAYETTVISKLNAITLGIDTSVRVSEEQKHHQSALAQAAADNGIECLTPQEILERLHNDRRSHR